MYEVKPGEFGYAGGSPGKVAASEAVFWSGVGDGDRSLHKPGLGSERTAERVQRVLLLHTGHYDTVSCLLSTVTDELTIIFHETP